MKPLSLNAAFFRVAIFGMAAWLAPAIFSVDFAAGSAPITEAIVGRPVPPRLSQEFLRYCAEVEYYATNVVAPLNRTTTYYISTSGNSGNNGTSSGTPKTFADINGLISGSSGNIAILLKCGDNFQSTTGINTVATCDNGTLGSYGTGARPVVNAGTSTLASGGTLWTLATGNRYTATVSQPGDIWRTLDRSFLYRWVASTAEVESTPFSVFWSGGTLHMNDGGADPDLRAFEYTLASTTDDSGIEIVAGSTGWRVDGIEFIGWGADGGAANQEYGIKFSGNGTDKCVVTNCRCTRSARHNLGLNGGANSGAFMFVGNCEAGMDTEAGAAPYVFYQQNGGQEIWLSGNSTPWGAQPITATRTWADGMPVICHTNSTSTPPGFVCVLNHRIPANPQGFGCHQGIVIDNMAYQADPNLCDAVIIGTRMDKAYGTGSNGTSGATPAMQGTLELNGFYQFTNLNTPYESMGSFNPRGFVYNTFYQFDFTSAAFTNAFFALYNPAASVSDPKFRHCFFEIISNGSGDFGLNYDTNFAAAVQATVDYTTGSELSSSVWSVIRKYPTSTADVIRPALANSSSCLKANAFWNVSADGTYVGISNTTGAVTLTGPPIFGAVPSQGSPLALAGRGGYVPYDFSRLARNVTQPTIGPIEMPAALLIGPTAAEMAQQIWALDASQITTAGSIGERAKRLPNVDPGAAGGLLQAGSNAGTTFATLTSTGAFSINGTNTVAQTGDAFSRIGANGAGLTDLATQSTLNSVKTKTDFLPSATAGAAGGLFIAGSNAATTVNITGNVSGSVGSVTSGVTLADGAITGAKFNGTTAAPLTAAQAAFIDASISGVSTGGVSAASIADAVLDEALAGHATAGTLGKAVSDVLVDTSTTLPAALDDLPSLAEFNARTLAGANYATAGQASDLETAILALPTNGELATALDPLPTAAENRDALLNAALSGFTTAGTVGKAVNDTATEAAASKVAALAVQSKLPSSNRNMAGEGTTAKNLDQVTGGSGSGTIIPVNQVAVPAARTWTLSNGDDGLEGDVTRRLAEGATQLFAIDFRNDLAANGRLASIDAVAIVTVDGAAAAVDEDGVTWSLVDADDAGIDRSQAKIKLTGAAAGIYKLDVTVTYGAADGGGTATGRVTLEVTD